MLQLAIPSPDCRRRRLHTGSAQVTTDKRSGISSDPNRADDPGYIARLVRKVVTVSVETVKCVNALPPLGAG